MKRIHVRYDGSSYTIGDRDIDELQNEVAAAVAAGSTHWLIVNDGEGTVQEARLLISATTSIALIPIDDEGGSSPSTSALPIDFEAGTDLP